MTYMRTLVLVVVAAGPLAGQEPAKHDTMPSDMMKHEMHCPMMQGMMDQGMMGGPDMMSGMTRELAFGPERLLARKEALGLTAQQEARLTALRDAATTAHDSAGGQARTHLDALAHAMGAAMPDTTAVRQHFLAAHGAMGSAHWVMLRAAAQAKAVLTDAQRGRVEGWMDERRAQSEDSMDMMKDCPMMQGGMQGDSLMHPGDR